MNEWLRKFSSLSLHFSSGKNKLTQTKRGLLTVFLARKQLQLLHLHSWWEAGGGKQELLKFVSGWSQKMIRSDEKAKVWRQRRASGTFEGVLGANYQAS